MTTLSDGSTSSSQIISLRRRGASTSSNLVVILWLRRWRQEHRLLAIGSSVLPKRLRSPIVWWARGQFAPHVTKTVFALSLIVQLATGCALSIFFLHLMPAGNPLIMLLSGLISLILPIALGVSAWRRVGIFPFDAYLNQASITNNEVARSMMLSELYLVAACRSSVWWTSFFFFTWTLVNYSSQTSSISTATAVVTAFCIALLFVPGFFTGARFGVLYVKQRLQGRLGLVAFSRYAVIAAVSALLSYGLIKIIVVTTLSTARDIFTTIEDLQKNERWEEFGTHFLTTAIPEGLGTSNYAEFLLLGERLAPPILAVTCLFTAGLIYFVWHSPLQVLDLTERRESASNKQDFLGHLLRIVEFKQRHRSTFEKQYLRSLSRYSWAIRPGFFGLALPSFEAWCYFGGGIAILRSDINESSACFLLAVLATFILHNQATETREALMPVLSPTLEQSRISLYLQAPTSKMLHQLTIARVCVHRQLLFPSAFCTVTALTLAAVMTGHTWAGVVGLVAALCTLSNVAWVQWYMSALLLTHSASERRHEQEENSWTVEAQSTMQGWVRYLIVVFPGFLLSIVLVAGNLLPPELGFIGASFTVLSALAASIVLPRIAALLSHKAWQSSLSYKVIGAAA